MKGTKLYKVEVWHYSDGLGSNPQNSWTGPPISKLDIPDCESFEINFAWADSASLEDGPYPDHLAISGSVKTYNHFAAFYLASRYPVEDYAIIGDCLLLYYRTDDGTQYRYRFNGVYFGAPAAMKTTFTKSVDTGKSPHSTLTWLLARFHNDAADSWNDYAKRVSHEWWNGGSWSAVPLPGPAS